VCISWKSKCWICDVYWSSWTFVWFRHEFCLNVYITDQCADYNLTQKVTCLPCCVYKNTRKFFLQLGSSVMVTYNTPFLLYFDHVFPFMLLMPQRGVIIGLCLINRDGWRYTVCGKFEGICFPIRSVSMCFVWFSHYWLFLQNNISL